MPWMRVSIGVGAGAVVAGIAGMILWIHDGSHFFDLAVAVALAGFLTLIASLLTRVFGSSHGSQDDAFRRGRSMGYDAGFLEGHRAARPVVVPMLHVVGRAANASGDDYESDHQQDHNVDQRRDHNIDQRWDNNLGQRRDNSLDQRRDNNFDRRWDNMEELEAPLPAAPMWRRDAGEGWYLRDRWDRGTDWLKTRRTPLLVGALALGVLVVLTASMLLPTSASTVTSGPLPGAPFNRDQPSLPGTPAVLGRTPLGQAPVAAVTGVSPVAPTVRARVAGVAGAAAVPAGAGVVTVPAADRPNVTPGAAIAAPVTVFPPAVAVPVAAPQVVPVVAAPVVPLTAAQQTAADAKAAADLTAANAAAAAAETARVAAAAAEATRLQALADAYAVAHPAG